MTDPLPPLHDLLPAVRDVARQAGEIAMRFFRPGAETSARIWSKAGGSPVTEADVAVDTFLKIKLSELLPSAGWLSEETVDDRHRLQRDHVWVVDPIDGTRAFLSGSHDWSVAIALLREGRPLLGVVQVPAHETLYEAVQGDGARRNGEPIRVSACQDPAEAAVCGPKPFVDRLARFHPAVRRLPRIPSLALRIARVAEGSVDIGLVAGDARDWDIAASDVILVEAGGALLDMTGTRPLYNQVRLGHGELVALGTGLQRSVIEAITAP